MTSSRRRIGKACTEWKPAPIASGANCGQRAAAWPRSALTTGSLVRTQSRHGPSSDCSWNSSSSRPDSLEEAMNRSRP